MKLIEVIVVYDCYVIAESDEEAIKALKLHIKEGLRPSDENALEVLHQRSIRAAWEDERPIVGADISDKDFETLKGRTTNQVFALLHTKPSK